jgi:hypothetical protein
MLACAGTLASALPGARAFVDNKAGQEPDLTCSDCCGASSFLSSGASEHHEVAAPKIVEHHPVAVAAFAHHMPCHKQHTRGVCTTNTTHSLSLTHSPAQTPLTNSLTHAHSRSLSHPRTVCRPSQRVRHTSTAGRAAGQSHRLGRRQAGPCQRRPLGRRQPTPHARFAPPLRPTRGSPAE